VLGIGGWMLIREGMRGMGEGREYLVCTCRTS